MYDFSSGLQGTYYRPLEELGIPVYLGPDLRGKLAHISQISGKDIGTLVNELLEKDLEIIGAVSAATYNR
ncbi:MAG: hypothetical protein ACOYM2_04435 [Rectinemataceae bacterium]